MGIFPSCKPPITCQKMASEEVVCDFGAPSLSTQTGESRAPKRCKICRVNVKEHFGPHGEGNCLFGVVAGLRQRIDNLEKTLLDVKEKHQEDLVQQEALHHKRVDGLMTIIEGLQDRLEEQSKNLPTQSSVEKSTFSTSEAPRQESPKREARESQLSYPQEPPVQLHSPQSRSEGAVEIECFEQRSSLVSFADVVVAQPPRVKAVTSRSEANVNKGSADAEKNEKNNEATSDGFTQPKRRKPRKPTPSNSLAGKRVSGNATLRGAQRVSASPFHLAGISLDSTADDIVSYCRTRSVSVTGCSLVRSRVWGTQSAKLFVATSSTDKILDESFWPEHIRCRKWDKHPPATKQHATAGEGNPTPQ